MQLLAGYTPRTAAENEAATDGMALLIRRDEYILKVSKYDIPFFYLLTARGGNG